MKTPEKFAFDTRAIHVGQQPDSRTGAVVPPISLSATYTQSAPGQHKGYVYGRAQNPTREDVERCLASLDNGIAARTFSSGTAAAAMIIELLPPNSHIVATDDLFGGTHRLFELIKKPSSGLQITYVDMTDLSAAESAITPQTKLLWVETPTNPLLKIIDLEAIAALGRKRGILTVCDGTFTSPYVQRPLDLGIDLVLHSTTKYLNGHSDMIGGAIVIRENKELAERFTLMQKGFGAIPSPFDCYLLQRGIKTLGLRMERHCSNALKVAQALANEARIERVIYPGLTNHPQHAIAAKQMHGFGGMVSVVVKDGLGAATVFAQRLKVFSLAESLGAVESLISHPATMTHATIPKADREKVGITDGLLRLSVGIEDPNDLIEDIHQALR